MFIVAKFPGAEAPLCGGFYGTAEAVPFRSV
jgi:hypothetical protein